MDIGGETTGPFDEGGLKRLARNGGLTRETLVCMVGASTWTTADKLPFVAKEDWEAATHAKKSAGRTTAARADRPYGRVGDAILGRDAENHREETLAEVRALSCYMNLRRVIEFLRIVGFFFGGLLVALAALAALGSIASLQAGGTLGAIMIGGFGVLVLFLSEASAQAMLLGVDAVDLSIAERTDKVSGLKITEEMKDAVGI